MSIPNDPHENPIVDGVSASDLIGDPHQSQKCIGVIGIGLMGTAIGHRLLDHGYALSVWSRTREETQALLERGAVWSDNPLANCDRAMLCLYNSQVVSDVLKEFESGLRPGQIVIDTTTGTPDDALRFANQLKARGAVYLDAPVSGSSVQTRGGEVLIMVAGDRAAFSRCADLWSILGKRVHYTGSSGSASRMKLVTNLVLGLNRAALAEGLAYAAAIGVDPSSALEVLQDSAAASRVMDVKGQKMVTGDYSVQARLSQHLKDVRIILETGRASGLELPLSATHCHLLEQAEQAGCGDLDNSSIIRLYQKRTEAS